ncbi:activating signal cointegrator 1 complex subunit 3 [Microcaecilia unicolor]|uniref:Activating signal cointegrator 1 complex subunit 3-like n=1 Tax=Microcaecilia unicolor TaxID=1415580 RepID=A0A6P7X622_9AMPH|nr:activating signal cointegrator 1 complex subunit 3-like [Microcaecilia unicolor]
MALPRLTGALRSFSNVTKQSDYNGESDDLMKKKSKLREYALHFDLTWKKIIEFVLHNVDKKEEAGINGDLKDILQAARQIVGAEYGQDAVESGAVFLFKIFHVKECVGQDETKAIKQMFGPFPPSSATAACDATCRITSRFTEEQLADLVRMFEVKNGDTARGFGKNIIFSLDMYDLDRSEELPVNGENGTHKPISLDYCRFQNNHLATYQGGFVDGSDAESLGRVDGSFLRCKVEKYIGETLRGTSGGPVLDDLCCTLFEMLASSKSNDELQNELFELLGPEGFELIEKLLQHRHKIVAASLTSSSDDKLQSLQEQCKKFASENTKPNYGCQVTIQSEQEKQLMKQYRREEKRNAKKEKRTGDDGEILGDGLICFDPRELRMQREQALLNARTAPILGKERDYWEKIHYPHVYDSHAEAMKTSAFIGGSKLLLPEGIERENNKMFEEVKIPATESKPIGFEEKPVYINEMDEIGQLVFRGVKRLNRIQSIVFETAYKTNENMLICAPTGAGKTNIAMLTVLHEIRQHIQQGVIKKDEFKIVYVAPMKALAAEMTNYFSKRLEPLGITVKELTGDMQLSKSEILRTQEWASITVDQWLLEIIREGYKLRVLLSHQRVFLGVPVRCCCKESSSSFHFLQELGAVVPVPLSELNYLLVLLPLLIGKAQTGFLKVRQLVLIVEKVLVVMAYAQSTQTSSVLCSVNIQAEIKASKEEILDKIDVPRVDLKELGGRVEELEARTLDQSEQIANAEAHLGRFDDLQYKIDYFENRGRRKNLRFRGVPDSMVMENVPFDNSYFLTDAGDYPEKWDVVTRKSVGDIALSQLVRLLIVDEVHLLHEDRGPVLESLIARTLRQVESTQSMIRILGLSATLPNYLDVASFLHVNPFIGLFFFDGRFRPVPLGQTFIGIKTTSKVQQLHDMEEICYENILKQIKAGHQVY